MRIDNLCCFSPFWTSHVSLFTSIYYAFFTSTKYLSRKKNVNIVKRQREIREFRQRIAKFLKCSHKNANFVKWSRKNANLVKWSRSNINFNKGWRWCKKCKFRRKAAEKKHIILQNFAKERTFCQRIAK